jgi:hypothetical protein
MSQDEQNAVAPAKKGWQPVPTGWLDAQRRERDVIRAELSQVRGFMPLLMKARNGGDWSPLEREQLMANVRAIAHISPYVLVLALPGSFIALPALAWWLDRRRQNRDRNMAQTK